MRESVSAPKSPTSSSTLSIRRRTMAWESDCRSAAQSSMCIADVYGRQPMTDPVLRSPFRYLAPLHPPVLRALCDGQTARAAGPFRFAGLEVAESTTIAFDHHAVRVAGPRVKRTRLTTMSHRSQITGD